MTSPSPSIEDLFQQIIRGQKLIIEKLDEIVGQSTTTNTKLDVMSKRVKTLNHHNQWLLYTHQILKKKSHAL